MEVPKVEEDVLTSTLLSFPPIDHGDDDVAAAAEDDDDYDYKAHAMSACLFVIAPIDIEPEVELPTDVSMLHYHFKQCRAECRFVINSQISSR